MGKFTVGEEVKAYKVTRHGVMNPEPYNLGRVGKIVAAGQMGREAWYSVEFGQYGGYPCVDTIDEVCLERS